MNILLMDFGNTRLKWSAGEQGEKNGCMVVADTVDLAALYDEVGAVDCILVASVRGSQFEQKLVAEVLKVWGVKPVLYKTPAQEAGLVCCYEHPQRLGVDRWLAMLALWVRLQNPFLVVDSGSAMTVDAVGASGKHLGGFIVPGLHMSVDALLAGTKEVLVDEKQFLLSGLGFGRSTGEAVCNGAIFARVALVEKSWSLLKSMHQEEKCTLILTGGDADKLSSYLDIPHSIELDLVLEGLRCVGSLSAFREEE